ncbi:MAG: lipoate-protein ligase [Actinomycetia bacterium]|nr:lipoate-protein ligase [Actinomycetes bacterium]
MEELIIVHAGFGEHAVPYEEAWELQRRTHERRATGDLPDICLLLEHPSVYTAGKRTEPMDRPLGDPGAPVIEVDRGGKITWHGPGMLMGYPIIKLPDPIDVVAYVRLIEEMLIRVCADLGVAATRVEGRSGVWVRGTAATSPLTVAGLPQVPDRKIASIGIRVSRGVTMHGFQLNSDCELSWFDKIVACGIRDVEATSLSRELGRPVRIAETLPLVERHLAEVLGATETFHRTLAQIATAEPAAR